MERTAKLTGQALVLAFALLLGACDTIPKTTIGVVQEPKVTIDARLLEVCNVKLTPIEEDADFSAYVVSYGEAITMLNACSCKFIETRNIACTISKFPCKPVKSCESPEK